MSDPVHIATSEVTCSQVPVQIEGTLTDGRHFYFRARHTTVRLGLGSTADDAITGPGVVVTFNGTGSHAVGWMDANLARALLDFLVGAVVREEEIAAEEAHERHCHADWQGPCVAVDCPIAGPRPRPCPGTNGPQHPAVGRR